MGLFCFCLSLSCPLIYAGQKNKIPIRAGYLLKGITEVDQKDASAALAIWAEEICETYDFDANAILYESPDRLIKDFISKKLDYIALQTIDYLEFEPVIQAPVEMANYRDNRPTIRYLLLVNADSGLKELAHLKNKRLVIKKDTRMAKVFMDVNLMKAKLPRADCYFASIQEKNKENQLAYAVFFGQADACIMTQGGFAVMTELNPQMGRKLKVLASSPELVEVVGLFHKDYPPPYKEKAIHLITKGMLKTKRARQLKLLMNTEGMMLITEDHLKNTRTLFAEYNRLKDGQ